MGFKTKFGLQRGQKRLRPRKKREKKEEEEKKKRREEEREIKKV